MTTPGNGHVTVAIIGGGFTGLAAAYDLARSGVAVTLLEAEKQLGGLASTFEVGGQQLERFYHHWFTNDEHVLNLVDELGLRELVTFRPSKTDIYHGKNFFRLSTPLDVLRFSPLRLVDRIRLGLLVLRARRVKHWNELEDMTAEEWLRALGGESVYRVVWEPLLRGKFGTFADDISAVWFWNKLKLRGGSRGSRGEEQLAYLRGGFATIVNALAEKIEAAGASIRTSSRVESIARSDGKWNIRFAGGELTADTVIATPALPLIGEMIKDWARAETLKRLNRIHYLANVCLVLELSRSLSNSYWVSVADPEFPFVAVIEHTNFEEAATYAGKHVVYLSKYLPHTDRLYRMHEDEVLDFAMPHLQRMFPDFSRDWIVQHHVWRARWAQPVMERRYSSLIPEDEAAEGFYIASMAQIYPEDRGTNYAVREGRRIARMVANALAERQSDGAKARLARAAASD